MVSRYKINAEKSDKKVAVNIVIIYTYSCNI